MRRALSLIALGATLFTASAQTLALGTIRAVDTPKKNKDSWSVKGATIEGPDFEDLEGIVEDGDLSAMLVNADDEVLDTLDFTKEDCKFLRNERGVVCKIKGANLSVKLSTSTKRTKESNKIGMKAITLWNVAGSARRREFEDDLTEDGLTLVVAGIQADADDCTEKTLANGQTRLTCA
jgi:hypothetical protein